jgi:hypothetical protein
MSNVTQLKTAATEEQETAVQVLEDALVEVRQGQVRGVAIAIARANGGVNYRWSTAPLSTMLGAVAVLMHRLAAQDADDDIDDTYSPT